MGNNTPLWFSTEQNPAHTFGVGNYSIELNASNSAGYNISTQVTFINVTALTIAPISSFNANVTSGTAPLDVGFTDTSTNTPTSWNWSLRNVTGNNTPVWFSTEQNPAHTFGIGNYSIELNASNSAGYNISTQVTFINVTVAPIIPVASFSANVTRGSAPLAVSFTDTSTNTPTSWNWSFTNVTGNNTPVWWGTERNSTRTFGAGSYSILLNASNSAGYNLSTQVTFINVTAAESAPASQIGVVRNNNTWLLDSSGEGKYGASDLSYVFGKTGDVFVTGDWNNDGKTDLGVVRNNYTWLLDASGNGAYGAGDLSYVFGKTGDVYVAGDWNTNGKTKIGVVRNNNTWYLDASGDGRYGAGDIAYSFGKSGDAYVTGDWNMDGKTEIGVVRNNNAWYLDASGDGRYGAGDSAFSFGKAGDAFITGDWNADGRTEIGVVRNGNTWLLDASGDGKYGAGDLSYVFGKIGDRYVTGKWS